MCATCLLAGPGEVQYEATGGLLPGSCLMLLVPEPSSHLQYEGHAGPECRAVLCDAAQQGQQLGIPV